VLEHFQSDEASYFIKDIKRVLKDDGILRIVVPDLEQIARLYLSLLEECKTKPTQETIDKYYWILMEMFDQVSRNKAGGNMIEWWQKNPIPAKDFILTRLGAEFENFLFEKESSKSISIPRPNIFIKNSIKHSIISKIRSFLKKNKISNESISQEQQIGRFRLSGEVHYKMYDSFSLKKLLEDFQFREIRICDASESRIFQFLSYQLDIDEQGRIRKPDSIFVEAIK
jgi:hypothetical protein